MNHENDKLKFGAPGDAIVMACPPDVNPDDDSVRYYGGLLVCESASAEWRRRIVACVNACAGSSTEWLEFIVSDDAIDQLGGPRPFETRHGEVLREALRIMAERDKAEKQRDELLSDAQRYRWLRIHGLQRAWVSLGTDCDGENYAQFKCEFKVPEPTNLPYEDDEGLEWADKDFDVAIDAAIASMKGGAA